MATNKSVNDVSLAVLCAAIESAINPLWDSICKNFDSIYNLSDEDIVECSNFTYSLSDKLSLAADIAFEYEVRCKSES